jgi:hypothetical protein
VRESVEPIEFKLELMITPLIVYRALTSQTELRKWWAPRVIMSRNIVSQEEGRDMEMRPLTLEEPTIARYSWRALDWNKSIPSTIINLEIHDKGVSRGRTGEGIVLEIIHDGWHSQEERDKQEKIWKLSLEGLKALLLGKNFKPWWESGMPSDGYRQIALPIIRQFTDKMEKDVRSKQEKKIASQVIWTICEYLDGQGKWFMKDNGNEFELRLGTYRLFAVMKNGNIVMAWRDLEKILGDKLQDFASRMAVEQDLDLHIGKSQDRLPAASINPALWNKWCLAIIQHGHNS